MYDELTKLMNLEGLHVESVDNSNADEIVFQVRLNEKPSCPHCGSSVITKNGRYSRRCQDLPFYLKASFLVFEDHEYRCTEPGCEGKIFVPQVPCIPKKGRTTVRLQEAIAKEAFGKSTFLAVASRYFVAEETVRRIFMKKLEEYEANIQHEPVAHLGIDEAHLAGKPRCVLVDASSKPAKLIDILPKVTKNVVADALTHICSPETIKTVTMDMCTAYREAVILCLPNAKIIIDHFHVTMHLIDAMEQCRRTYYEAIKSEIENIPDRTERTEAKNKLKGLGMNKYWFTTNVEGLSATQKRQLASLCLEYPEFGRMHSLKESFRRVYDSETREEAEKRYRSWAAAIPDDALYAPFREFTKTVGRWKEWIFNFFDEPVGERHSNGPIEALNGSIKNIMRDGYGYKFEVLRGKLLYGENRIVLKAVPSKTRKHLCEAAVLSCMNYELSISNMHILRQVLKRLIETNEHFAWAGKCLTQAQAGLQAFIEQAKVNENIRTPLLHTAGEMDEDEEICLAIPMKTGVPLDELELELLACAIAAEKSGNDSF